MKYTLVEEPNVDIHRFKMEDGSATIEVVQERNATPYYNVYNNMRLIAKHLTHEKFTENFLNVNGAEPFDLLVYHAQDMYNQLVEE